MYYFYIDIRTDAIGIFSEEYKQRLEFDGYLRYQKLIATSKSLISLAIIANAPLPQSINYQLN